MKLVALIVIAIAAGCGRADTTSCDDSLAGVWTSPAGEHWMMLDNGATLEAYPMFDDARRDGDVVIAPRVLDLRRDGQLSGELGRRSMRGDEVCEARAFVRVTACHRDVIELERGEPAEPIAFAPCRWQPATPPRVERWRRD